MGVGAMRCGRGLPAPYASFACTLRATTHHTGQGIHSPLQLAVLLCPGFKGWPLASRCCSWLPLGWFLFLVPIKPILAWIDASHSAGPHGAPHMPKPISHVRLIFDRSRPYRTALATLLRLPLLMLMLLPLLVLVA